MVDVKVVYPQELEASRPLHKELGCRSRMVALDLDGTLLQSNGQMSEASVAYLRSLYRRGLGIAFCTGRSTQSTYAHIQRLNLPGPFPIVTTNGAKGMLVYSEETKTLFEHPLSFDVTQRTQQVATKLGYVSLYYYDDAINAHAVTDSHIRLLRLFEKLTKSKVTLVDAKYCAKGRRPPSRIVVLFWDSDSRKVARAFEQELQGDVTLVPGSKGLYLEILSGHVHKGHRLQDLCHSLDIPLSKCVAIGDGDNDIEFLDMAGFGICMKNGNE